MIDFFEKEIWCCSMKEGFVFKSGDGRCQDGHQDGGRFSTHGDCQAGLSGNSVNAEVASVRNRVSHFVGIKVLVFLFLFTLCFLTIVGCLSDINTIPRNQRIFPDRLENFPASRFDGKFWAGTVSTRPVGTEVAINCYLFNDIGANSLTWASSVLNPRHRTTASTGGTYQPIDGVRENTTGVHFETAMVNGVEMIVSNFFITYVDVPAGNTYFDAPSNWGKVSLFTYPRVDFNRLGTFANSTIAQLVVIEDYKVVNGTAMIRINFPPSFYAQRFAAGTSTVDKINDLKRNLIRSNASFIVGGSLFESLWKEHFLVSDSALTDVWRMQSSSIIGSTQTLDCGRDYEETGNLAP